MQTEKQTNKECWCMKPISGGCDECIITSSKIDEQTAPFNDYSYIDKNADLSWLLSKYENASDRYMEAESFILEIAEMKWYQRIFCLPKIIRFLNSRSKYESNNLKLK